MIQGSLIFAIALLLISILTLIVTFAYPFKAKLFPLIVLVPVLILLIIQIFREVFASKGKEAEIKERHFTAKHINIFIWMLATMLMLLTLGFIGTVIFLPFLYLRFQKESWTLSISLALGCGIFFYGLFNLALKMPLYQGLIIPIIFDYTQTG